MLDAMRVLISLACIVAFGATFGQCYPDKHNTTWFEGWVSCEASIGPIADYGEAHWIQYDLGATYELSDMKIWNYNDPALLNAGAQNIQVDYSMDGENWVNFGEYALPIATGQSTYEGVDLLDFDGTQMRYLLLTIIDTHGHTCGALAEIRVDVVDVISSVTEWSTPDACFDVGIYPNPHQEMFNVQIDSDCGGDMQIDLFDAMGRKVDSKSLAQVGEATNVTFTNSELPAGIYFLRVEQGEAIGRYQLVKTE